MKIKEILWQSRRDFEAIYECHCGHTRKGGGYDDRNFHDNVIPRMKCDKCGEIAKENYRPLTIKYPDNFVI